jgi:hypothetical protein
MHGDSVIKLAQAYDALAFQLSKVAMRYSFENRAAKLELGRRKEARIKVSREVELRVAGRPALPVILENLSVGGACLEGLPAAWDIEPSESMSFGLDPTRALFTAHGRVTWRKRGRLGIAFSDSGDEHELRIAAALYTLLKKADSDQSEALTS